MRAWAAAGCAPRPAPKGEEERVFRRTLAREARRKKGPQDRGVCRSGGSGVAASPQAPRRQHRQRQDLALWGGCARVAQAQGGARAPTRASVCAARGARRRRVGTRPAGGPPWREGGLPPPSLPAIGQLTGGKMRNAREGADSSPVTGCARAAKAGLGRGDPDAARRRWPRMRGAFRPGATPGPLLSPIPTPHTPAEGLWVATRGRRGHERGVGRAGRRGEGNTTERTGV